MKQALVLVALIWCVLEAGRIAVGDAAAFAVAYGAITQMALLIAATFLWLWAERATPLALGMALSWLGAGLFAGRWWWEGLGGQAACRIPPQGGEVGPALWLAGAVLHFAVIHRSFGYRGAGFLWLVVLATGVSILAYALA